MGRAVTLGGRGPGWQGPPASQHRDGHETEAQGDGKGHPRRLIRQQEGPAKTHNIAQGPAEVVATDLNVEGHRGALHRPLGVGKQPGVAREEHRTAEEAENGRDGRRQGRAHEADHRRPADHAGSEDGDFGPAPAVGDPTEQADARGIGEIGEEHGHTDLRLAPGPVGPDPSGTGDHQVTGPANAQVQDLEQENGRHQGRPPIGAAASPRSPKMKHPGQTRNLGHRLRPSAPRLKAE